MSTVQSKDNAMITALADPQRRQLIGLLNGAPGSTVSVLAEELEVQRALVLKQLKHLGEAGLLTSRQIGREKLYYADTRQLRTLLEPLLGRPADTREGRLSELKKQLEEEKRRSAVKLPRLTYGTLIRSGPGEIWEALRSPERTASYWRSCRLVMDGPPPATYRLERADGSLAAAGTVLSAEPSRRLELTWGESPEAPAGGLPEVEGRLLWEWEPLSGRPGVCRVTITVTGELRTEDSIRGTDGGWPGILAGLKTLLETGEEL
ncbi:MULTISPECIES: ArsR/SmtB family transcription factor [Paenibacillus]|uniref:ArsR/SmtB family transcription factor n=1 Tax=Paenibacillus TaxID=44249 RepID=UPI0022B92768|nr:SRPBCC domain-containing protein [Paenibacillus caseinilyticus]MCZ8521558.1 SRPBCC domain-containing protein [Paenibacillus caseinilyticus]